MPERGGGLSHWQTRYPTQTNHSRESEIFIQIYFLHSGAFEVSINNDLIHSKLASLAFPDYGDVVKNVKLAAEGEPVSKVKEQPITDCIIQ